MIYTNQDARVRDGWLLLPNGNVFETGGGLINREDPVYEASMINTANLEAGDSAAKVYTEMAVDPEGISGLWRKRGMPGAHAMFGRVDG